MFKVICLISSVLLSMCSAPNQSVQQQTDYLNIDQNEGDELELGHP